MNKLPIKFFLTQEQWRTWLANNYQKPGVWLKFYKKNSGIKSLAYSQALDEALCFGWIDGQSKSLDDKAYLQKFVPRGPKSVWSQINTQYVARLIKEAKMTSFGLQKVEDAKKDGRWERAYASSKNAVIPEDFLNELKKNSNANKFFQSLNKTNLYAIYYRLISPKKEETREKRKREIIKMLAQGKKLH